MNWRWLCVSVLLSLPFLTADQAAAAAPSMERIDQLASNGKVEKAISELETWLEDHPEDGSRQLALGVLQLFRAYQESYVDFQKLGGRFVAEVENGKVKESRPKNPPKVTYKDVRRLIRRTRNRIQVVQRTLRKADRADTKCAIHLGRIRMDVEGVNRLQPINLFPGFARHRKKDGAAVADALFVMDQTDALFLEFHCQVVLGLLNFHLGHDFQELFHHTGHYAFWNADSVWDRRLGKFNSRGGDFGVADAIATLHLVRWPVHSKKRIADSHQNFLDAAKLLSKALRELEAEEDDDHELIAGPHQTSVASVLVLTSIEIKQFQSIADSAVRILDGKSLLPTIRTWIGNGFGANVTTGEGVNVKRAFLEPRKFDLVLWVQGSAAKPYHEKGKVENALVKELFAPTVSRKLSTVLGFLW